MKIKILLLCLFVVCAAWAKPIIIKGKINGKLPEALRYNAPVNGSSGFEFCYTAVVDANGNFEINTDISNVAFIDIYYNYQPAGYVVAVPGGQYNIDIIKNGDFITTKVTGTDAPVQQHYNAMLSQIREGLFFETAQQASKIEDPKEFENHFSQLYKKDFEGITTLYNGKLISKNIFEALTHERQTFYAATKSYAILIKHSTENEATKPNLKPFQDIWEAIFRKEQPGVLQSPWCGYYLMEYKNFKAYQEVGFNQKNIVNATDALSGIKHTSGLLPKQYAECFIAQTLYGYLYGDRKDKGAITVFNYLKQHYPKSGYISYFEPKIAPVIAFFAETESLPQGAAYVDNYRQLNTFEELVKKFEGQKLFIDVWATWCGPCRDEFKYKDELYKILKANNVTVLYISVDKEDKDETWKKMIGHYGLQGHHIRVNPALDLNITKLFNSDGDVNNTGILIPWYMLVGSNGTVHQLHAASPSDISKLEAEIKKM
ncbi:hypothetical protein AM493_18195 [Flavobacterium akiainvivens]|uniref:Thioredoxin domain-containing protein n=1 Tax=Flavobacterium akiainvivens TaxID=1202724 RepID=A0A0M9VJH0_9FLAO|nr:TlpA disulfide reductase family protein [Flavobacterium akiainvivens]KOS07766.1 hypothetical protein AM493_18195 [Flavobacterium akiainvivens]SFQ25885.1 Thiol-disulfide isomerase or thioredoxin [Flavobacterium akiainvivens]